MSEQQSLLDWQPPADHKFLGSTFVAARDEARLRGQLKRVHDVLIDGKRRSLRMIADEADCPEASASARFRDLRRLGFPVRDENAGEGRWVYWMERPPPRS